MTIDDMFDDSQPQSRAFHLARERVIELGEAFKQGLLFFRGNAGPDPFPACNEERSARRPFFTRVRDVVRRGPSRARSA